jgi:hypothetical protein
MGQPCRWLWAPSAAKRQQELRVRLVDVITDFVAGQGTDDAIYFSRQLFSSFQQVLNNAAQVGQDTWIGDGLGNTVVLQNVGLSSLHPDDFGFI